MRVIKITFLQTFLFKEIFMYKIRLDSLDNINETIEIITPDINEALDELLTFFFILLFLFFVQSAILSYCGLPGGHNGSLRAVIIITPPHFTDFFILFTGKLLFGDLY